MLLETIPKRGSRRYARIVQSVRLPAARALVAAALLTAPGCFAAHAPPTPGDGSVRCAWSSGEVGPVVSASVAACGGAPAGGPFCWNVTVGPDGVATSVSDGAGGLPPALVRCVRDVMVGACLPDAAGRSFTICPLSP